MNLWFALVLGAVQGLTEFLPISSSAHLVIIQSLIPGFSQQGVMFDVLLHLATTLAVVVYFRNKIFRLSKKYLIALLIGTIPAAFAGYFFKSFFESLFESVRLVGIALVVTALVNYLTDRNVGRREKVGNADAFLVGIAQAVAIIPGISRSGSTIFAGTSLGIDRKEAAQFSFLLSVPAVVGANVLEILDNGLSGRIPFGIYAAGFIFSFLLGIVGINLTFRFLWEKKFKIFALYSLVLALIAFTL